MNIIINNNNINKNLDTIQYFLKTQHQQINNNRTFNGDHIPNIYYNTSIIPSFFNNIIILQHELDNKKLQMLYNMLLIGGYMIYNSSYVNFFADYEYKKIPKTNLFYFMKQINNIYIFPKHRVVEFIIIGCQKAGTTAMSVNIGKHPDIYINTDLSPFNSEIHFFDIYWRNGIKWYKSKFDHTKKIGGEKTPDLIYFL